MIADNLVNFKSHPKLVCTATQGKHHLIHLRLVITELANNNTKF